MNESSININVLNYLLEKLEHRTRSILKKKTKYTEQPSIPTNEFLMFITEVQDDLKQSIAVIKKLLQDNKQMETIYLNQTLTNSHGDINKVISDLKQDNNCLIAEIENLKLQLMYNSTNNSSNINYNKDYRSYSEEQSKRKEDIKNMKDVISDMKRNKLQIKQEIMKHFSNNNSNNNSNVVVPREGVITEWNEEDSQSDNVKYKCKCYRKHLNSKNSNRNNNNNNNNKRRNKPYFVNYTSPYGKLFTDISKERNNMK